MPDYTVNPYDVLFFRGNKSFHFGAWRTEGVFPPYPSTFQGFVRSKLLDDYNYIDANGFLINSDEAKKLIGDDKIITIEIIGPYLIDTESEAVYFKTPSDLFRTAPQCDICYSAFPLKDEKFQSDNGFELLCPNIPDGKLDNLYPAEFISLTEICDYRLSLSGIKISEKELCLTEDRVGITLDTDRLNNQNRAVQDKRFYVTPYNRMGDAIGFYFNVNKPLADGALKLGSESHFVHVNGLIVDNLIEQRLKPSRNELVADIIKTRTFRLILLQHGVFEYGWIPFKQKEGNRFEAADLTLELLFAFTQPPLPISGYSFVQNSAKKQQGISLKALKSVVPAGAVYMFRISDEVPDGVVRAFVDKYDNRKIENLPHSRMGFNHVILGNGYKL